VSVLLSEFFLLWVKIKIFEPIEEFIVNLWHSFYCLLHIFAINIAILFILMPIHLSDDQLGRFVELQKLFSHCFLHLSQSLFSRRIHQCLSFQFF
jgi:hypothetical protein